MPGANASTNEPPSQELPPGTRLEEFIIERVLGSGGFGITYLARDSRLGRKVVIKENLPAQFCWRDTTSLTVQPRQSSGEDADNFQYSLESFEKEAATLASLDHPGIVKVLRSFEANGTAYFVMPFVEGVTFDEVIKERETQNSPFIQEELIALLEKVLEALAYLHDRGIYHRDIKPGNILITKIGAPVLIDFGAARQRLSERSLTVIESPGYTPFEQLQSRGRVGPWSDLFALGGTLYKAITGETPAKAADRAFDEPVVPLLERPEMKGRYSQTMLRSIDHAMRPKLSERPQSAEEWMRSLTGILPPVSTKSAPPSAPTTTTKVGAPIAPLKVGSLTDRDVQKGTAVNVAMAVDGTSRKAISRSDLMWLWGGVFVIALLLAGFGSQLRTKPTAGSSEIVSVATGPNDKSKLAPRDPPDADMMPSLEGREAGESIQIGIGEDQKMAFQFCPAGSFRMGSPTEEKERSADEKHVQVRINHGFWLGQYEVTQGQWAALMKTTPAEQKAKGESLGAVNGVGVGHPMYFVSWEDAQAFISKLNQSLPLLGGWKYALPTEAQWEYACRAGTESVFSFGDVLNGREANCDGNYPYGTSAKGPFLAETSEVGSYQPNKWGFYDMHGNVREWCADWYGEKLPGGGDPVGISIGSSRVLRGGSWSDHTRDCRAAFRFWLRPGRRDDILGFRVAIVRDVSATKETVSEVVPIDPPDTKEPINLEGHTAGQIIQFEISQGKRMAFNFCPAGSFTMGSLASEADRSEDEEQVQVRISQGFWMGQMEVTQGQWAAVMGSNPSEFKGDDLPVDSVSWEDAQAFVAKLNQSEALPVTWKYALPTEAQWEYACRAGTESVFSFGDVLNGREANCDGNYPYGTSTYGPSLAKTSEVGSYRANGWGLYDMHGNVFEWCEDAWDGSLKLMGGNDPLGTVGSYRVCRGGSWGHDARDCRAAYRNWLAPGSRYRDFGFRVAAVPAEAR